MKEKILVVDDEETMRRSLADILRLEGYAVQAVSDGPSALEAMKREDYDMMLLDLKMPGMDGLEVLQAASRISPETSIVLLTAHGSLESAIEALRQNVHDYLLKPASPQQILDSVAGALARRAETRRKQFLIEQLDASLQELKGGTRRPEVIPIREPQAIQISPHTWLDYDRRELWMGKENGRSKKVKLTPTEAKLFKVLWENRGKVLSHRELVMAVQGYEVTEYEAPEVLRPLVSRLRQKLAALPGREKWVSSVRGTGYVLEIREDELP